MASKDTITILLGVAALVGPAGPVFGQCRLAKLMDGDADTNDLFGKRAVLQRDTLCVGVPGHNEVAPNSGVAYQYVRDGTEWTLSASLFPPDGGGNGSAFARGIALDGDALLCTSTSRARGYIFEWSAESDWVYTTEVMASDYHPEDAFGEEADMEGGTIVISAPWDNNPNGGDAGSVYVFDRDPNGAWEQTQKLIASDGQANAEFGFAIDLNGDVIAVGAWVQWVAGVPYVGKAYLFERDPDSGLWTEAARLLPPDIHSLQDFGCAVTVDDDANVAIVGALADRTAGTATGAAFVYERDAGGTWSWAQTLRPPMAGNSQFFGCAVAVQGDQALIGAYGDDPQATNAGAAYLFIRESDGIWRQHAKFTASDGQSYDRFGESVAMDGSWAVIGAPYDDDSGTDAGSAYIFRVGPDWSGNGVPDLCECPGDIDFSGSIDLADLSALLTRFGASAGTSYEDGDLDGDTDVDLADLSALLEGYGVVCPG